MNGRPTGARPMQAESLEAARAASSAGQRETISSAQLLQGRRVVEILHNGEIYRLQATRLGKLILTK